MSTEDKKNRSEGRRKEEFLPSVGAGFGCCHDCASINFVNEKCKAFAVEIPLTNRELYCKLQTKIFPC